MRSASSHENVPVQLANGQSRGGTLQSLAELEAYLMEGLTMQMQTDTRKGDPAEDRGAFLGGVLGCLVVLAALLVAYLLV